ncbi:hypothetical protein HB943_06130 [Listeria weihenstephanensis]|uniref:ArnR1-like winged helix-turn-helix domain-containing protein n=1 Tax=Listeria weihenstephanensis TaxID=1006155 RepID=A0A841Z4I8_9LIST|nr:hypothetical protein [Listeria weihenstephanensis]MBC1500174.1 hypothetical protein [Listeria weihenstephanensis]
MRNKRITENLCALSLLNHLEKKALSSAAIASHNYQHLSSYKLEHIRNVLSKLAQYGMILSVYYPDDTTYHLTAHGRRLLLKLRSDYT